nr:PREDICTED: uncharacterized protein LOC108193691 isoform X2 [Daucus carota subsp. sativus]
MATAAFKSSSRRSNSDKAPPKRRTQRSLSVSAVSRRSESDIDSDFLITRDNPLFLSTKDSPPALYSTNDVDDVKVETLECEIESGLKSGLKSDDGSGLKSNVGERGRSISRNVDNRRKNGVGRSLSRGPSVYGGASESEVEQESATSTNYGSMNNSRSVLSNVRRSTSVRRGAFEYEVERVSPRLSNYQKTRNSNSNIAFSDRQKNIRNQGSAPQRTSLQSVSGRHSVTTTSDDSVTSLRNPSWDDAFSTGSMSEAEEKTIKAVCEQMKGSHMGSATPTSDIYETVRSEVQRAISSIQDDLENSLRRRSNATGIATADVTSIAPDSVKPGAVELVLDIRREYATKLEESQERARKLRSDLAVEEHRGQELSRILKETLPEPKVSSLQRSYTGRRSSSERKRMSKRLTEEAMSYFDECVSISTFDSSDFSAAEDAPVNSFRDARLVGSSSSLPEVTPYISATNGPINCLNHKKEIVGDSQLLHSPMDSVLPANVSPLVSAIDGGDKNADSGRKTQFSLAREPTLTTGLRQEIKSYIKSSVDLDKDETNSKIAKSDCFSIEDYDLQEHAEGLLFDRVSYKNRIESGSLHLCTAGIGFSFSPFASVL